MVTCSGVSFFHGGNDCQKGMGLIMLILIGTVPAAYALNRTMHESEVGTRSVTPQGVAALAAFAGTVSEEVGRYHSLDKVPAGRMVNIRNDKMDHSTHSGCSGPRCAIY
jgi:hypothetical protein